MHPVNAKKLSYLRAQASILRSTGLLVKEISKKLKKSERWVVKWSSRNDGFKDKKRTGRPKILNETAKRILNKAKYKRGNSTRQFSQQLASKGHIGGKNTMWRFMKSEGWRPLRRQKRPLLTAKQRAARLKFAKQYKNLTEEEWEDFLFSDECPKYLFQLPNPKTDIMWGSQQSQVPPAYHVKKVQNGSYGAEWKAAVSLGYTFNPKDRLWLPITTTTRPTTTY